jgi:excisionase family DNA binding protein
MNIKEKEFLNFKEIIELLGVSRSTLYKLSASGKIPHYKPTGGKLFFKRTEVLDWVKKRVVDNATNNDGLLNLKGVNDVK